YCSPRSAKLTGTEGIAEPVWTDQTLRPVSAVYAANSPVPSPWNTRFPAVERTPLLVEICSSTDQRSVCCTGARRIPGDRKTDRLGSRAADRALVRRGADLDQQRRPFDGRKSGVPGRRHRRIRGVHGRYRAQDLV